MQSQKDMQTGRQTDRQGVGASGRSAADRQMEFWVHAAQIAHPTLCF